MAEGFVTRRGGVGAAERTAIPSLTLVSKDASSITVTFTNNDGEEATIFYGLTTPPDDDSVVLASNATSSNITFSGLDDDTQYTIFAYALVTDPISKKIKSEIVSIQVTTDEITIFNGGIQWDQPNDTVTRLGDGVGLTAGSDFTALGEDGVWNLRRCMVNDDLSINYYIDPADPTKIGEVVNTGTYTTGGTADYTGSHGQVMVEIPKFYWKYEEPSSNVYQWWVSPIEFDEDYEVHPAFITNGVTKNFIYMSAFDGSAETSSGTLRSISGVKPLATRTISEFRSQAQARGTGWQMQTYWATHALQVLYSVEYANFDSQTTIGKGAVSGGGEIDTGETIGLGNESGMASGTNGLVAISYRGVENFWGNIWKWVDGLNIRNGEAFVSNENFASDTFTGSYTSVGILVPTSSFITGFISNIRFPHFLATELAGSSTSHLHDFHLQNTVDQAALFGGDKVNNIDVQAGAFSWSLRRTSSDSRRGQGTRLQIL